MDNYSSDMHRELLSMRTCRSTYIGANGSPVSLILTALGNPACVMSIVCEVDVENPHFDGIVNIECREALRDGYFILLLFCNKDRKDLPK